MHIVFIWPQIKIASEICSWDRTMYFTDETIGW